MSRQNIPPLDRSITCLFAGTAAGSAAAVFACRTGVGAAGADCLYRELRPSGAGRSTCSLIAMPGTDCVSKKRRDERRRRRKESDAGDQRPHVDLQEEKLHPACCLLGGGCEVVVGFASHNVFKMVKIRDCTFSQRLTAGLWVVLLGVPSDLYPPSGLSKHRTPSQAQ